MRDYFSLSVILPHGRISLIDARLVEITAAVASLRAYNYSEDMPCSILLLRHAARKKLSAPAMTAYRAS